MNAVLGVPEMSGFYRVSERHAEIADRILQGDDRASVLAVAARAAFAAQGDVNVSNERRRSSLALAAAELDGGRWSEPVKCVREISMHVLSNIRHQELLGDKLAIIDAERERGSTDRSDFSHLSSFDAAIVRQMFRNPHREEALRDEANGRYETMDRGEQEKLLGDFESGVYLTSAEIHRIDLEANMPSGRNGPVRDSGDDGIGM